MSELPDHPPTQADGGASAWVATIRGFFQVLGIAVDKFGWHGVMLGYGIYYFETNATQEQKQRLIDVYVFGEGLPADWPLVALSILFLLVIWAQHTLYRRRIQQGEGERKAMGAQKSRLQEQGLGKRLTHGEDFDMKED